jgi:light-harvesting complex I chlorophyll a/b binding protein 1
MVAYSPLLSTIAAFQCSSLVPESRRNRGLVREGALHVSESSFLRTGDRIPQSSVGSRRYVSRFASALHSSSSSQPDEQRRATDLDEAEELEFLRSELSHLESLEEILSELEEYDFGDEEEAEDDLMVDWDEESLEELLGNLPDDDDDSTTSLRVGKWAVPDNDEADDDDIRESAALGLERALLQGVVPVSAGVGSECLPGDFGFDPLGLADVDLFRPAQTWILNLLPGGDDHETKESWDDEPPRRPKALVLRDYREAEIRHGRLAMLAAVFWPLQEMLDRFVLSEDQFGPLIYGPVTLPYFPLVMTAIMLLLGYLDIYSQAIKDMDQIGEAFLPGDCFWDPLQILQGAPDRMKRNMQERELFNGRAAMLAVAAYILEEGVTHKAFIEIESNALLLEPAYQVPFIQRWLDAQFSVADPESAFFTPTDLESIESLVQTTLVAFLPHGLLS